MVRKNERTDAMPRTPQKNFKYSRRQWDGIVRGWKNSIHSTVDVLEGRAGEGKESKDEGWKVEGSLGNWADEVEEEDDRRRSSEDHRRRSSASCCSDQCSVSSGPSCEENSSSDLQINEEKPSTDMFIDEETTGA